MKKQLLIMLTFAGLCVSAQQSIPNGNFETWNTTTYQNPQHYVNTSNRDMLRTGLPFNCIKTADAYHGSYALKLTTLANATDSMFGYIVNTNADGPPETWHGGVPYSQKPIGLRAYYKSDVAPGDTALIFVAFSKAGTNIGTYAAQITGTHAAYTLLEINFSPALSQTPDSIILGATSSNAINEKMVVGSMLQIDSISLTGVTSQPTQLNGDFELWDDVTIEKPTGWYVEESGRDQIGAKRNTTAYKGTSAIELTTVRGDNDNNPRARGMNVSTGYYPQNCDQCNMMGGYPFTNRLDTLAFWYKYAPMGNSVAEISTRVKKNGNIIGGNGLQLDPSSTYRYMELLIQAAETPDTLIVEFHSSRWEDSLLTQVGAVLIMDELQLKSQPLHTGVAMLSENIKTSVYPNPGTGVFNIDANVTISTIEVMNLLGEIVFSKNVNTQHTSIDLSNYPKGAYFYRITSNAAAVKTGRLLVN